MLAVIFSFVEAILVITALNAVWNLCLSWSVTLEHAVCLMGCLFVGSIPKGVRGRSGAAPSRDEPLAGPPLTLAPRGCYATAPFSQLQELRFLSIPFPLLLPPLQHVLDTYTHTPSLSLWSYFLFIPITIEFCYS